MVYDGKLAPEEFKRMLDSSEMDYHEADLLAGKIGSYNGISDAADLNRLQKKAVEETRLGIPLLFGYDVIHGYRTVTPIPLGESCAWDETLWEETARMAAREAAAGGIHMTFAPMVDVSRDARWGRVSEGAGEDVLISSRYGAAKVRGFQGDDLTQPDTLAACIKHFAAYGACEAGKDYNRVDLSMQKLHEEYLPPFKACIDAGARAVMPAFNDINGVPCTANAWLLGQKLRKEWGFTGMTISDSSGITECVTHGYSKDPRAAALDAILAGVDMDMMSGVYAKNLGGLFKSGELSEEILDLAVAHVLRLKFELGLFDQPYRTDAHKEMAEIGKPENRALARRAALESIVLLKNKSVLPLNRSAKIGVIGALAEDRGEMTGTWAIKARAEDCVSLVDAFEKAGIDFEYTSGEQTAELLNVVYASDVLIVTIGEKKSESGEAASKSDIGLPPEQISLLETALASKKPVVAVLFNGRPLAIPYVADNVPAILEAWHPGVEAGNALTDILFGDYNPCGKLTTTFPNSTGECPVYYAHIPTGRPGGKSKYTSKYLDTPLEPVYPFGWGLSYTSFTYSDLKVCQSGEDIEVSVTVENTGEREGTEVVQCYFHDVCASRVRPVKQLADFCRIRLLPGEKQTVGFLVTKNQLGYYDPKMKFVTDAGEFEIYVGGNSKDCLMECIEYGG